MSRDHKKANQRRNELARQRGFTSYAQQRRYERNPASVAELRGLPEEARSRRAEVLDVVSAARRHGIPVAQAAAERGVPLSAVAWWGAPALASPTSKSPSLLKGDRILRAHPLVVDGELQIITTRGSNSARKAQLAFQMQRAFIEGAPGSREALGKLAGSRIGGHPVETDPDVLGEIGRRGELGDIGEMYRAWAS